MLLAYGLYKYFQFFQRVDRLYMSESDVYRRQILTDKDGPRAERVNPILGRCWTSVEYGGQTLSRHWVNVSCLPG